MKNYRLAFLWLVFITAISTLPNPQLPDLHLISADKIVHAGVYGVLAWLVLRGFARSKNRGPSFRERVLIFGWTAGYGVLMEFVQYAFIPGRYYEYGDMLANALGAAAAAVLFRFSTPS